MNPQVALTHRNCLLLERPDVAKTNTELEHEIIELFKDSIESVRASYARDGER
jgi:hypothetical protein